MISNSVRADIFPDENAREHKTTVSLKTYYEGRESVDEKKNGDIQFSQKMLTKKISNKEILEGLVREGVISTISGWSIVLISGNSAELIGTFITKNSNTPIDISAYFGIYVRDISESYKGKHTAKKDSVKGTANSKAISDLVIDLNGIELEAQGLLDFKSEFFAEHDLDVGEEFIKSAKLNDLTGEYTHKYGVVTGSVKASNGKKITIN